MIEYIKSLIERELAEQEDNLARAKHQYKVCRDGTSARLVNEYQQHVDAAHNALKHIEKEF